MIESHLSNHNIDIIEENQGLSSLTSLSFIVGANAKLKQKVEKFYCSYDTPLP
jgi:hypothetical protein